MGFLYIMGFIYLYHPLKNSSKKKPRKPFPLIISSELTFLEQEQRHVALKMHSFAVVIAFELQYLIGRKG